MFMQKVNASFLKINIVQNKLDVFDKLIELISTQ